MHGSLLHLQMLLQFISLGHQLSSPLKKFNANMFCIMYNFGFRVKVALTWKPNLYIKLQPWKPADKNVVLYSWMSLNQHITKTLWLQNADDEWLQQWTEL